ncbi:MAG: UvrD-helicase domain-containing protein [Thermoleophilia bacterium]
MTPPTPEQQKALDAMAAAPRTAIAAGAGAGKTTLMVEAIWRDVENDEVPLDGIMAMAYNRAAAAHLIGRLQDRFADADDGRGPDRVGLDVSDAWVGTFHQIAARLVRAHPFAAGVDPEFGELDETEATALAEEALDHAFDAAMVDQGFVDLVADAPSREPVRVATRQAHDRLRAAGQERPRLVLPAPLPPAGELIDAATEAAEAVAAHARARDDHGAVAEIVLAMARSLVAPRDRPRFSLNCAAALKDVCTEANEVVARLFQQLVDLEALPLLRGFALHLELFSARYAELKAERGALDYEDLLLAARRVLRGGHGPRPARVYVDEFQDANALQAEIVDLLGAERTVVVGDGAQAIYGFRHADSEHFTRRVGERSSVRLRDNHRSQTPLMDSLNGLLGVALHDEPAFSPLRAVADPKAPGPAVEDVPVRVIDVAAEEGEAVTREQEAEVVAARVDRLVERGYEPRDIAVLFRALTQVEPYRAAIARHGHEVHLVAGRGFFTHDQVADTLALLALVENPLDEAALIRVLASPYVAASDADLVALRLAAGDAGDDWPATGALWPALSGVEALKGVVGVVEGLRPLLRERGLPGLVEAAASANGYDLAVLGLPDGARRFANLRRLVRMAADFAAVRGPSLRGFLAMTEAMADAGNQDPGEATLVDPGLNAVRLMTIHGVKGQEFPAVIVADGSHGLPQAQPMVVVDHLGVASIRFNRVRGGTTPALDYARQSAAAKEAAAAEERRVIYVAATRAERHLEVIGRSAARSAPDAPFSVLSAATGLSDAGVVRLGEGVVALDRIGAALVTSPEHRPRIQPPPCTSASPPSVTGPPAADPLAGRAMSFTALQTLTEDPRSYRLRYLHGARVTGRPVRGAGRSAGGAVWGAAALGDVVHAGLARHDWGGPAPAAGWAAAEAAARGLDASPDEAARAERLVAGIVAGPLAARIRAGRARIAERPFALALDGALLTGAIDLMVDEGDGRCLIVDWKSHALGPGFSGADVVAGYGLQRDLYALVALEAGFARIELCWVPLEQPAAATADVVRRDDVGAVRARVGRAMSLL